MGFIVGSDSFLCCWADSIHRTEGGPAYRTKAKTYSAGNATQQALRLGHRTPTVPPEVLRPAAPAATSRRRGDLVRAAIGLIELDTAFRRRLGSLMYSLARLWPPPHCTEMPLLARHRRRLCFGECRPFS